ncbi:myticin-B [Mytilus galloprovincialis]|uniref:myticin-B n=1 Tax=Mytilus galloprovincialis TaxID=29158 RepID=UPI003F7BF871
MKATILLAVVVAVFVAGTEAHPQVCTSYYCSKFCSTGGCTRYGCRNLHRGKLCFCLHCSRVKFPFGATQDAKSMNELEYTPIMKSMENLDNGMDML